MRWIYRRYAAFRRWSQRFEDRFMGTAFLIRIGMLAVILSFAADPGTIVMEYRGMHRSRSLGTSIGLPDKLICAFHEAGHAVVGRALDPDSSLTGLVVIDRNSNDDAAYYGYTSSLHAFTVLPSWLYPITSREVMMLMAEAQGGVAVEAFIVSRHCEHFANRIGEVSFDDDTIKVLEMLRLGYDLHYRIGWQYAAQSFGRDVRMPDEMRAGRMLAEVRRIALGTAVANKEAIRDLAIKTILTPVRHGWHLVGENELSSVVKKHHLVIARCK